MRDVLAKYWVIVHVALLAGFLAWVHGGTRVDHLGAVPWLSLAVLEMTLLLPAVRRDEPLDLARRRVWRAMLRDPLLYLGIALNGYLLFQFLNGGQKLMFDASGNTWSFAPAPIGWGPCCIDPAEARQMLYWFLPAFAAVLGIRHGTNRRGKLYLLRALVANGALISLFGVLQYASGTTNLFGLTPMTERFFASFGYANHAGSFFTLLFAVSIGLLAQALLVPAERRHAIWLGPALVLNLAGALLSLSRLAILLSLALFLLGGLYVIRHAWKQISNSLRFQVLVAFLLAAAFGAAFLFFAAPNNPVRQEIRGEALGKFVEEVSGVRWQQTMAACNIWRDHPWFGVGGWGFRHYVCLDLDESRRALLQSGGANVHNDAAQFLAEHGLIGFGLILGAVGALMVPLFRRLRQTHMSHADGWTGERWLLFRISPITVLILAGTTFTCLESFVDLPFRSPAILVTWSVALACASAFLPAAMPAAFSWMPGSSPKPAPESSNP